ncbi:MAG: MoaD family protein [Anaerolineae bacterium]|nr:MoaD family protein [Thermoflexales bacterium]MDW8408324.1 MoaD family protein [Anaerolineae bacterium]
MARVWIPALLRGMTGGQSEIEVAGQTVGELIDQLEVRYPGIRERLMDGDRLRPNIAVIIDGVRSRQGLRQPVNDTNEVHFVPAISGGCSEAHERSR